MWHINDTDNVIGLLFYHLPALFMLVLFYHHC